ncbi:MAG: 16S rRNA (cytosine(1402)-N(4))-methyltransferase RsmH [Elusimicrobia bacterium]|nr:16S rRNA (cytosine(1402)-N(4))-methyltransferase RsmH [Elusimicrobiota bacterium]
MPHQPDVNEPTVHTPVLLEEAIRFLVGDERGFYVDLTLGMGGHTQALLERFPQARCLGLDRDPQSLELARERLQKWGDRVTLKAANFAQVDHVLAGINQEKVSGMLFDLGLSTVQILNSGLGLSYQKDEPLDMRLDRTPQTPSAAELLAGLSAPQLERLLTDYGELPRPLARKIARCLSSGPIKTTGRLIECLQTVTANRGLWARVFQALRIAVNREMENLERMLETAPRRLAAGGRLVGISFHSLEDRLVKRAFRRLAAEESARLLTRSPVVAGPDEVRNNPKSRSAKLRALEMTR